MCARARLSRCSAANGAGKSTLLKSLAGLKAPQSGSILFEGEEISGMPAYAIARLGIGYVPQHRGLFAGMTVAENLSLGRMARDTDGASGVVWSEEHILELFPRLKERLRSHADYLSGGEQQMMAVARALSGNVRLLLLDEPFEGLALPSSRNCSKPSIGCVKFADCHRRPQSRCGAGACRPLSLRWSAARSFMKGRPRRCSTTSPIAKRSFGCE